MITSQKAAISLLISVVLVAVFSVLAFTGFFNLIETRFYNPSITSSIIRETRKDAEAIDVFFAELEGRFSELLENDVIQRSFLPNQAARDIFERTRLYGILLESERGLQSVRFIDDGGIRIHFSTNPEDITSRTGDTITYKNYDEVIPYAPYQELTVPAGEKSKITLDEQNERIIFSFRFENALRVYQGTALYSLSIRAVLDRFIKEGRLKVGEDLSVISNPPGVVSGLPNAGKEVILPVISSIWKEGHFGLTSLDSTGSGTKLALISTKTSQELIVGRAVSELLFAFPQAMKIILLTAMFFTIFLTAFLVLNVQPDTMTIIQNRLKGLQLALIRDYYERKGEIDWNHWYHELEMRREDVRAELKRGITDRQPAVLLEDIDSLIDKSWDEILTAIGGKREKRLALADIDEDKLQNILNRMLVAAGNIPAAAGQHPLPPVPVQQAVPAKAQERSIDETEEPEELEELEELEEETFSDTEESRETEGPVSAEIPVIEEFSGFELGPAAMPVLPAEPQIDLASTMHGSLPVTTADEIEELEELEELEDESDPPAASSPDSGTGYIDIASEIEFSPSEDKDEPLSLLDDHFEIVSPFANMHTKLNDKVGIKSIDDNDINTKTSGRLEELSSDYSMSLVYQPFQNGSFAEPQELSAVGSGIIKHKNGVNYVDKKLKTPTAETAKILDPKLKNLVDSVIGKK